MRIHISKYNRMHSKKTVKQDKDNTYDEREGVSIRRLYHNFRLDPWMVAMWGY